MRQQLFGALVVSALGGLMTTSTLADDSKADKTPAKEGAKAGKCVHSCSGYAECKGNGNNSCKGKNSCANEGLVPKACSAKKDADACGKVVDAKKEKMCTWLAG